LTPSPFYPVEYFYAGKPMTQEEVIALFNKDQSLRTSAWVQSGGEFFTKQELEYGK
jgi:hypothetical protein